MRDVMCLVRHYFMTYGIITGAHFLPYAWFYRENGYAVMAGLIPVGSLLLALTLAPEKMFLIGIFIAALLVVLAVWLWRSARRRAMSE